MALQMKRMIGGKDQCRVEIGEAMIDEEDRKFSKW